MNKTTFILGVDVSKNTLDLHCHEAVQHVQIPNTTEGFRQMHQWCRLHRIDLTDTLVVLEYTGGYEYRFLQHLQAKAIAFVRIPGLAIKRSLGIVRGKTDRVDAARIARYGRLNDDQLRPQHLNATIVRLKELLSFRKRVVRDFAADKATLSERRHMKGANAKDPICRWLAQRIKSGKALLEKIEAEIKALIQGDDELSWNFRLLTSIKGIGPVNAWLTIAYTENFEAFTDPRKYAVYVGVVPFEHTSGTSIKGRKRVSDLANKELKADLDRAATAAMVHDPELRKYAQAKITEGKPFRLVCNNVKFKLILRMFAVVKRGSVYVDNYQQAA
ncbi:MAG: IS110 family transposase [Chitinophagaceae bacterium]|nr:MAG: IS110 family transposase [Chitinophagaceae bacterium]